MISECLRAVWQLNRCSKVLQIIRCRLQVLCDARQSAALLRRQHRMFAVKSADGEKNRFIQSGFLNLCEEVWTQIRSEFREVIVVDQQGRKIGIGRAGEQGTERGITRDEWRTVCG